MARLTSVEHQSLQNLLEACNNDLAIAVALPYVSRWGSNRQDKIWEWMLHSAPPVTLEALQHARKLAEQYATEKWSASCDPHLCEKLLALTAAKERKQSGVYYTPPEVADYLITQLEHSLINDFELKQGYLDTTTWESFSKQHGLATQHFASHEPVVQLLDPALGSGLFPLRLLHYVYKQFTHINAAMTWTQAVCSLLPRLAAYERMLPALVSATVQLVSSLAATEFEFSQVCPIPWHLRDALVPPNASTHYPFIMGNPPYASLSQADYGWIESLISDTATGYTSLNGQPLHERKHWLHDTYVKFFRLAQWHVEQANCGAIAFVTNHGYLDNVSFRGMRHALVKTFPKMHILNLHGNAKSAIKTAGNRDENIFPIATGVATSLFVKPPAKSSASPTQYAEIFGSRKSKLEMLKNPSVIETTSFTAQSPNYEFTSQTTAVPTEYRLFMCIKEIMPICSSAPVTARDKFVIAFTLHELQQRLEHFCDLSINDDIIRQLYFNRTRSSQYASGDSRGWKLSQVRRSVKLSDLEWRIIPVQYRSGDIRIAVWHTGLIDWSRPELSHAMLSHNNLALIVRRQSPTNLPANFFWVTRFLPLDGILRSDNRGNETIFPLWQCVNEKLAPNFSSNWLAAVHNATKIDFANETQLAEDNLGYIYSWLFSEHYRTQYAAALVRDYPRIPLPNNASDFQTHAKRGKQLITLHASFEFVSQDTRKNSTTLKIEKGYPQWKEGAVWVNRDTAIATVSEQAWNFQIGAHYPIRKWLKDRVGRELSLIEQSHYHKLVHVIESTYEILKSDNGLF